MAQGMHLSQRMSLQQVLAPQLQQSLAMLQAPTLELQALVTQEMAVNPVLEEAPELDPNSDEQGPSVDGETPISQLDPAEPPSEGLIDPASEKNSAEPIDDFAAEFERLSQMDQDWREHFSQTNAASRNNPDDEEKRQFMFDSLVAGTSMQQALIEQVRDSNLKEEEYPIAEMIIGNIDENGYLQSSVDELAFSTNIPVELIRTVVKVIQGFHPAGVGARDLRECLLLQLERLGEKDTLEYKIIDLHMDRLGRRRFPEIARALGVEVEDIQEAAKSIGRLSPRPGRAFVADSPQYIVPEVFVQKNGDEYIATVNNEYIPRLRISHAYKDLMANADSTTEVREYIREKIRAGKFLIKSIHQRQSTILNIAKEIVSRQRGFMENGVSHLKPMTMMQVAEAVGVHETTVSRAVSGKYIDTPQGVLEMKYFFTTGIQTSEGGGVSNESVKELIAEMVRKEGGAKPLSDEDIVKMLSEKGINIARRTVAKYRTELNILPSHLRRVY